MKSLILFALGIALSALVSEEILGLSERFSRCLIRAASHALPLAERERWFEEWTAELGQIPGPISRAFFAASVFMGRGRMAASLTGRSSRRTIYSKRLIDLAFSGIVIFALMPLLAFVSLAVRLSGGTIFERQKRIGPDGVRFELLRFRCSREGKFTGVGRFLYRHSLNELPQLFNIFRGDMSLVGSRSRSIGSAETVGSEPFTAHPMKSGLTGLAVVSALEGNTDTDELARLEAEYLRDRSLGGDLRILARVVVAIFRAD